MIYAQSQPRYLAWGVACAFGHHLHVRGVLKNLYTLVGSQEGLMQQRGSVKLCNKRTTNIQALIISRGLLSATNPERRND
jgi:hypothetical protein